MPSPSKPTISKSGTRKKIVPHVPNSSLPKTAAPTTSNTVKKDDLSNTIPIKENSPSTPSRAPSTAPQSSAPRSTIDPGEDEEMEAFEHHLVAHRSTSESGLAETVRHVNAFLDSTKDKHSIEIPTVRLRDHSNFHEWKIAVELRLRMHQVWFLFRGLDDGDKITPVPNDHKLSLWYEQLTHPLKIEDEKDRSESQLRINHLLRTTPGLSPSLNQIISQPSQQNLLQMLKRNKSRFMAVQSLLQGCNLFLERLVHILLGDGLTTQELVQASFNLKLRAKSFIPLLLNAKVEAKLGELGAEFHGFDFCAGCYFDLRRGRGSGLVSLACFELKTETEAEVSPV
ncbi:hypothetical protein N7448_006187 [Penicillium atrosanguineum]|nr:hypothetical protein N7448_006187 [Penicillium atrosanguineum]